MTHDLNDEFIVNEVLVGERVDRTLSLVLDITRNQASTLISDGSVSIDGKIPKSNSIRLQIGQTVRVKGKIDSVDTRIEPHDGFIDVVYEDNDIVVINKQIGLSVHPGNGREEVTLANLLVCKYPKIVGVGEWFRPGIVHRLDKLTSGLLVIALNNESYHFLVSELKDRKVKREYATLVEGILEEDEGTIEAPLGRSVDDPTKMGIVESGKEAITDFRVISRFVSKRSFTYLSVKLRTGRTHQIRAHFSAIKHPVAGDTYYGAKPFRTLNRPFLHSKSLGFVHPILKKSMEFTSVLPSDLDSFLELLANDIATNKLPTGDLSPNDEGLQTLEF